MRNGWLWLAVMMVCGAWPAAVHACSCAKDFDPPLVQLQYAKAQSAAIYRARVLVEGPTLLGVFGALFDRASRTGVVVEVLEVLKGEVKPGDLISVPSGKGTGDCYYPFVVGQEYLVYAFPEGPYSISLCTRTQPVFGASSELNWLRTGMLPPIPVVLQRERVSCQRCDVNRVIGRLITPPGEQPNVKGWGQEDAEEAMKAGRPFIARGSLASMWDRLVMVGLSWDGKPFELTLSLYSGVAKGCSRSLQLRWCQRLEVVAPERGVSMHSSLQCIEPGEAIAQCDESKSRESAWLPLEALSLDACRWISMDHPECTLRTDAPPLKKPEGLSPVLVCSPGSDEETGDSKWHSCHVEQTPRPTPQEH